MTPVRVHVSRRLSSLLLCCLAGCAAAPLYEPPADTLALADVEIVLFSGDRNFGESLSMRGAVSCTPPSTLSGLLPKVREEPPQLIARSLSSVPVHRTRLPAGVPLPLRFSKARVDTVSNWDFVVVLEPGARYRVQFADKQPSFVNTDTGLEALHLPHDLQRSLLQCP